MNPMEAIPVRATSKPTPAPPPPPDVGVRSSRLSLASLALSCPTVEARRGGSASARRLVSRPPGSTGLWSLEPQRPTPRRPTPCTVGAPEERAHTAGQGDEVSASPRDPEAGRDRKRHSRGTTSPCSSASWPAARGRRSLAKGQRCTASGLARKVTVAELRLPGSHRLARNGSATQAVPEVGLCVLRPCRPGTGAGERREGEEKEGSKRTILREQEGDRVSAGWAGEAGGA